jgi:hypothetical protein
VIKLPIGDFELGIGDLRIGDCLFRRRDRGKLNSEYTKKIYI